MGIVKANQFCCGDMRCAYHAAIHFIRGQMKTCLNYNGAIQSDGREFFGESWGNFC
jgi:hypothetical protein